MKKLLHEIKRPLIIITAAFILLTGFKALQTFIKLKQLEPSTTTGANSVMGTNASNTPTYIPSTGSGRAVLNTTPTLSGALTLTSSANQIFYAGQYPGIPSLWTMYFHNTPMGANNYFVLTDGHDMVIQTPWRAGNLILSKGNGSFFVRMAGDTTGVGFPTETHRASANLLVPINTNIEKYQWNNFGGTQWVPAPGNSITANYFFAGFKPDELTATGPVTLTNLYAAWFYGRAGTTTNVTTINQWGFGTPVSAHITQSVLIGTAARTPSAALDVTGNMQLSVAGNGLRIKEGTNARLGSATLAAGTVTVGNTSITTSTRFTLTGVGAAVSAGFLTVSSFTAGTGFTIGSSSATDTRRVDWQLTEGF